MIVESIESSQNFVTERALVVRRFYMFALHMFIHIANPTGITTINTPPLSSTNFRHFRSDLRIQI